MRKNTHIFARYSPNTQFSLPVALASVSTIREKYAHNHTTVHLLIVDVVVVVVVVVLVATVVARHCLICEQSNILR